MLGVLSRRPTLLALTLILILAACGPRLSGLATSVGVTEIVAGTADVGSVLPARRDDTSVPGATVSPPTPIPTLPPGLSPTELKYRLLDEFPDMFFCDPDYYPVARADEAQLAIERFAELQANREEFQAIVDQNGLDGLSTATDDQKLLLYREHKRLAAVLFELSDHGYVFQLRTADSSMQGFQIKGFIDANGAITVRQRDPTFADCPICLTGHTLIDTPQGEVAVEALRPGDVVWTADALGRRQTAVILKTVQMPVPPLHQMIRLILEDGRELRASPGHPTADGRRLAELRVGDVLDGVRVVSVERVAYDQARTFDLLPAGGTGYYWANGVLMRSTLARPVNDK